MVMCVSIICGWRAASEKDVGTSVDSSHLREPGRATLFKKNIDALIRIVSTIAKQDNFGMHPRAIPSCPFIVIPQDTVLCISINSLKILNSPTKKTRF